MRYFYLIVAVVLFFTKPLANATTKGLSQIVTPDLQPAGDLSLSFQVQSLHMANPYELQAELGLTKFAEIAVFKALSLWQMRVDSRQTASGDATNMVL